MLNIVSINGWYVIWLRVRFTANFEHLGQRQILGRSAPFTGVDTEEGGEEG